MKYQEMNAKGCSCSNTHRNLIFYSETLLSSMVTSSQVCLDIGGMLFVAYRNNPFALYMYNFACVFQKSLNYFSGTFRKNSLSSIISTHSHSMPTLHAQAKLTCWQRYENIQQGTHSHSTPTLHGQANLTRWQRMKTFSKQSLSLYSRSHETSNHRSARIHLWKAVY